MTVPVTIIGLGAEGTSSLSADAVTVIANADFIAGGRRHLALIGSTTAVMFEITDNIPRLLDRLENRGGLEQCVVFASGDPLFYGIGRLIAERIGCDQTRVIPAVSSMQLAFARVGIAWQDASIGSVHGRALKPALLPLLGKPRIGLFTTDGTTPSDVAQFFVSRDLPDYDAWVCQNLGTAEESITHAHLSGMVNRRFSDLNVMIMRRRPSDNVAIPTSDSSTAIVEDDRFEAPESGPILLTHSDVRGVILRRFREMPPGPIWDIGAGLGGVSVELARAFPAREVLAIERSDTQLGFLQRNRVRFGAYNIQVVAGEAPECLEEQTEVPAAVFLGGSGGRLGPIIDLVSRRLVDGGIVVGTFVSLENLTHCLERIRGLGWREDLSQVQVSPARRLAGLTTFVPQRPVWTLRAVRPHSPGK